MLRQPWSETFRWMGMMQHRVKYRSSPLEGTDAATSIDTATIDKLTRINRGRAYYASPYDLGEFILADYIRNRRRRIR